MPQVKQITIVRSRQIRFIVLNVMLELRAWYYYVANIHILKIRFVAINTRYVQYRDKIEKVDKSCIL